MILRPGKKSKKSFIYKCSTCGSFRFGKPPEVDFLTVELIGWLDHMRRKAQPLT